MAKLDAYGNLHEKANQHKDLRNEGALRRRELMTKQDRKDRPIARGLLDYFPDALLEVSKVSKRANDQHNPGQPMHWAKEKSTDEADALLRHLVDRGKRDVDGLLHSAKVAWRALAMLQRELEAIPMPSKFKARPDTIDFSGEEPVWGPYSDVETKTGPLRETEYDYDRDVEPRPGQIVPLGPEKR